MQIRFLAALALQLAIAAVAVVSPYAASGDQPQASGNNHPTEKTAQKPPVGAHIPLRAVGHATTDTPYSYFSKSCANAYASGNYALAEQLCVEAIEDLKKQKITDNRLAVALANLASVKRQEKQFDQADKLFLKSLGVVKAQRTTDNNCLQYIIRQYAGLLRKMERTTQADFILENPKAVLDSVAPAGVLAGWAQENQSSLEQGRGAMAVPPGSTTSSLALSTGQTKQENPPNREKEIKSIADHDVVILIDKSGSMDIPDCPGGVSRWEWCEQQMRSLSHDTSVCFPEGMTIVVFSDDFTTYRNATIDKVTDIFEMNVPYGGTGTDLALEDELNEYFSRRLVSSEKARPLLIAVVTDGAPDRPNRVRRVILDAEERMTDPREIAITFLQVGDDILGTIELAHLRGSLMRRRPGFEIAHAMSFDELERIGLLGGLAKAVTESTAVGGFK